MHTLSKDDLRKPLRLIRSNIPCDYKIWADRVLQNRLCSLLYARKGSRVGLYFPIYGEPDLLHIADFLENNGYKIFFPHIDEGNFLCFRKWHNSEQFVKGKYSIPGLPATSAAGEIDVVVVPMLGWSREGYRIGYGGGYFDVFFSSHSNVFRIGVSYANSVVDKNFKEDHDFAMHAVLTERETIICYPPFSS